MKPFFLFRYSAMMLVAAAGLSAHAQSDPAREVLNQMDKAEANFRSTEANFVWDQYTSLVKETDTQKGRIYFRRAGNEIQMAVDIADPYPKYLVLTAKKLQLFLPRTDQVTAYDITKRPEFESFLVLGFGGGGHSLLKSFEVKYAGAEDLGGQQTSKLDLVPKSPRVRGMVTHILLWIEPEHGISVQQQFFQPDGDYRLAKYSDVKLNQKISDAVFKLKTDSKTTVQSVSSHN
jgi:outer membrane lipoprotein-sorting protein